jgi:subtilase family serine protease
MCVRHLTALRGAVIGVVLACVGLATVLVVVPALASKPSPAAARYVSPHFNAPGYTLAVVGYNGKTVFSHSGSFRLRAPDSQVTLQAINSHGVYAGPVVFGGSSSRVITGIKAGANVGAVVVVAAQGYGHTARKLAAKVGAVSQATPILTLHPSPAAAASIRKLTGVSNVSTLASRDACAAPASGQASCLAQGIVLKSTGAVVKAHPPKVAPAKSSTKSSGFALTPLVLAPASEPAAISPTPGTPAYLQQAYDLTALSASAGGTDTIGIVDAYYDPSAEADLAVYRANFGLSACTTANGCLSIIGQTGTSTLPSQTNTGWAIETSLDLDAASALCPNCHIVLVEANTNGDSDLMTAEQAASAAGVNQISNSWMSYGSVGTLSASYFVYPGIATLAAAGDSGWDTGNTNTAWPAGLSGVNAIGGTSLTASQTLRGFTETAWAYSGSGCADETKPSYQTDTGCAGRSYNDISADADPETGLAVYNSGDGGWSYWGGTSLATPLTAAYYALVRGPVTSESNVAWDYTQGANLNDPSSGNNSSGATCVPSYICNAGVGYDGPTGMGSISGQVIAGAPGVGAPSTANGYLQSQTATTATLAAGIYPNSEDTQYYIEYGPTPAYGQQTTSVDVGAGSAVVGVTRVLTGLTSGVNYHYRVVAVNALGTTYGYDFNFANSTPAAPGIDGFTSSNLTVSSTGAIVGAAIDPNGWPTTYHLAIGTSPSALTTNVPASDAGVGSQTTDQDVSQVLTGLAAGTTYYLQAVASSAAGTTTSTVAAFTTLGSGPAAAPANMPAGVGAPASTSAGTTILTTSGTVSAAGVPALASTPLSGLSVAATSSLRSLTGLADPASVLAVHNNCPAPTPGTVACMSQTLVNKATGAPQVGNLNMGTSAAGPIFAPPTIDTPQHLLQSYDLTALSQSAGHGDTVAIVDAYGDSEAASDLAVYRAYFDMPAVPKLTIVDENGGSDLPADPTGTNAGWMFEMSMDLDTVSSVCPNCNILLVEAASNSDSDLIAAEQTAARLGANQISNSWSGGNPIGTDSDFSYPGVATVAAAGDFGYLPNPPSVDYPAALPGVTAAGGTQMLDATSPTARGVSETAANPDSSGCSSQPKPSWQVDTGCPGRIYNDISAAGTITDGIYFYDPGQGYGNIGDYYGGGSSLSAAIVSAYYGLLDSSGSTAGEGSASWDYSNANLLNDITAGNNDNIYGSCSAPDLYFCTAGPGYDGPTGNGSLSGDAVAGAPGIAGPVHDDDAQIDNVGSYETSSTPTSVTLTGGVYPNQEATTYGWQYGPTTSYGAQTTSTAIGSGLGAVAVSDTITGLVGGDAYHYRLTATNASGTSYGYDYTMSTLAAVAPTIDGYGSFNLSVHADSATPVVSVNAQQYDTTVVFSYGTSPGALNSSTSPVDAGSGSGDVNASQTITGLTPNTTYYVEAQASNVAGPASTTEWESFTTLPAPPPSAPVNTSPPFISGTAEGGYTLSSVPGSWTGYPTPTYSYQWQSCNADGSGCATVSGATASSYTATAADVGRTLQLVVTADNNQGPSSATSNMSALVVAEGLPVNVVAPILSGSAIVGDMLSTTDGSWTGSPAPGPNLTYAWQRSTDSGTTWTPITGSISASYTLTGADSGFLVRAVVTATNTDTAVSADSANSGVVAAVTGPVSTASPIITGSYVGQAASTDNGSWTTNSTPNFTYQWQNCNASGGACSTLGGATGVTYTPDSSDLGQTLRVVVTAANAGGSASSTSAATAAITTPSPGVVITDGMPNNSTQTSGTILFYESGDVTSTTCTLDGASTSTCSDTYAGAYFSGPGAHTFIITVTGPAGSSSNSDAFTTTARLPPAPTVVITTAPPASSTSTADTVLYSESGSVSSTACTLDSVSTSCSASSAVLSSLSVGAHVFVVTVTGPAGSNGATADFTVLASPTVTITTAPPASSTNTSDTVLYSESGSVSSTACTLDSVRMSCSASSAVLSSLSVGAHVFVVTVTGPGGSNNATADFTVLPPAPTVTITTAPPASSTNTSDTVVYSDSPVDSSAPTLSGHKKVKGKLTASNGRWTGTAPLTYTYTWESCNAKGRKCKVIRGATKSAFKLSRKYAGHRLEVVVSAHNPAGQASATSKLTPVIKY